MPRTAPHSPARYRAAAGAVLVLAAGAVAACGDDSRSSTPAASTGPTTTFSASRGGLEPGMHRHYGAPRRVGNARARSYVVLDQKHDGRPIEVGVALDENALEGLPAPMAMPAPAPGDGHEHIDSHVYDLPMPERNPTPYRFVELDWNPAGHELPGIYDVPHFDFHFYTITPARRNAIDPADARFQQRADNLPAPEFQPAFYSTLTPPGAPTPAVPRMGVHWIDVRSPEIQGVLGHPENFRPFTTTFLHGSWDGAFIFDEPMVTRAFILGRRAATTAAQRDTLMPLPLAARHRPAGYYPGAYRVSYDPRAREYRIALSELAWRR